MSASQDGALLRRAVDRALRYLALRPRSRVEVQRYLLRHFPATTVTSALAQLQERGLLDDRAFARAWVRSRQAHKPRSSALMAREMGGLGVPREAIRQAVAGADDAQAAAHALQGFLKRRSLDAPEKLRIRAWQYLRRRGFSASVIRRTLDHAREEADHDLP